MLNLQPTFQRKHGQLYLKEVLFNLLIKIAQFIFTAMRMKHIGIVVASVIVVISCDPFYTENREVTLDLPAEPFTYNVSGLSDHIPTLGRVLFYDSRLSINNTVSCGSCHKQALAFSDNTAFSRGFENRITPRNSMPIQNIISDAFKSVSVLVDSLGGTIAIDTTLTDQGIAYLPGVVVPPDFFVQSTKLFWDGRESDLQTMVTRPIINHIEMGIHDMDVLAQKLTTIPEYKQLFSNAFDNPEVTTEKIATALSAFLLGIRSNQSKFDKSISFQNNFNLTDVSQMNVSGIQLNAQEELGRQLFFEKFTCNRCHESNGFADIGLDANPKDAGLSAVTGNNTDAGMFKIPSLRNVELTGPYMHDGRFKTLEEVLNHYSHGIKSSANLDERFKGADGKAKQLNMSLGEIKAIAAFLTTLTDYEMITDPKLSNPFRSR